MSYDLFSPWPTVSRAGDLRPGLLLGLHPTCKTCTDHKCRGFHASASAQLSSNICPRKLSCFGYKDQHTIVFAGLADPNREDLPKSFRRFKEFQVPPGVILNWVRSTRDAMEQARLRLSDDAKKAVLGLHNIQPAANIVLRTTERLVNSQAGKDQDEQLANAPQQIRDLHYAAGLLVWMIDNQADLINPDQILHGTKHLTAVYQLVHRLVRSFRLLAGPLNPITLDGSSFNTPKCFDSVANLFVILIHNAVKYSLPNQAIIVRVQDIGRGVQVEIESFGPAIECDEVKQLFSSGVRGTNALKFTAEGTGRGLYVARLIAEKHSTSIQCIPPDNTILFDNIRCGTNRFRLRLP